MLGCSGSRWWVDEISFLTVEYRDKIVAIYRFILLYRYVLIINVWADYFVLGR